MAGDGVGTLLPQEAAGADQVPRILRGVVIGVADVTPPVLAWDDLDTSVGVHPAPPHPPESTGSPLHEHTGRWDAQWRDVGVGR